MPSQPKITIRSRLLILLSLMVLLPTVLITLVTGVNGLLSGERQVLNQLESVATLKQASLEIWINSLQASLARLEERPFITSRAQVVLEERADIVARESLRALLQRHIDEQQLFEELFLVTPNHQTVLSTDSDKDGTFLQSHRQPYLEPSLQGSYSELMSLATIRRYNSVIVARPIRNGQGDTLGVLVGRANLDLVNQIMAERSGLGETGQTYLVGRNNFLLTDLYQDSTQKIESKPINQVIETQADIHGVYDNYRDQPVFGVYHWLPNLKVVLVAEQHQSEALNSLYDVLLINLIVAVMALIVALIVGGILVNRSIARPLAGLAETATSIAAGNLELAAPVIQKDEIGRLAQAFNSMTSQLRQLIHSLEQRVTELHTANEQLEREISERQRTERELRHSEATNRALLNAIPDLIFRINRDGIYLDFKGAAEEELSSLPDYFIGRNLYDILPTDLADKRLTHVRKALATNDTQVYEYQFAPDTILYDYEDRVAVCGDDEVLVIARNITERKRAERELKEREARISTILETVADGIIIIDAWGIIDAVNKAAEEMFGYPAAEMVGQNVSLLMPSPFKKEHDQHLAKYRQLGHSPHGAIGLAREMTGQRKDGSTFPLEVTVGEMKLAERRMFTGIVRDITKRKSIEQERLRLQAENARLETEVNIMHRLQQMLLPAPAELQQVAGLEIATFIEPADEIGGDYYDILQYEGQIKIAIGDVTGHGLESGVVMLMTQSIVRALLVSGETDPEQFMDILNRTIFYNIHRMETNKSLTLVILDYQPQEDGGRLQIYGQHENLIVVRRGGDIELIDTFDLGFNIGLIEHITEFVAHRIVPLYPGDSLVLYTDGITEAENDHQQLYGLERLCAVISKHWADSAEAIKEAVVADVQHHIGQHTIYDDLTLVIIKQQ